jgi:hypothetical protein
MATLSQRIRAIGCVETCVIAGVLRSICFYSDREDGAESGVSPDACESSCCIRDPYVAISIKTFCDALRD